MGLTSPDDKKLLPRKSIERIRHRELINLRIAEPSVF
jgi:hypothetical protein